MFHDCNPFYVAINIRLAQVVETSAVLPEWYDAWKRIGSRSTDEQRLAVYQAVHSAGSIPQDAGFYLIAWQIDAIASPAAETKLSGLDEQLDTIRQAHGLDDLEEWPGSPPPEYADLLDQYHAAWCELYLESLEQHGETEIAALFRTNRDEYQRRSAAGRVWFYGADAALARDR
jgi:hypothetical protein